MKISSTLFEAYLKCPTKCFLLAQGETGTGNPYAEWVHDQNESYRTSGIEQWAVGVAESECVFSPKKATNPKTAKWRLAVNFVARANRLESTIWQGNTSRKHTYTYDDTINNTIQVIKRWHKQANGRIHVCIALPYICGRLPSHAKRASLYMFDYKDDDGDEFGFPDFTVDGEGETVTHTYNTVGTYRVALRLIGTYSDVDPFYEISTVNEVDYPESVAIVRITAI